MSTKQVITNLKNIVKNIKNNEINKLAIKYSLIWISNRANEILKERVNNPIGTFGSNVLEWDLIVTENIGKLQNKFNNSASIEFGIGIVGEKNQYNISLDGATIPYRYNVPSEHKQDDGSWKFIDEKTGAKIGFGANKFYGYEGKSFLYDSCMEFIWNDMWGKLYEQAFNKTMERIIK